MLRTPTSRRLRATAVLAALAGLVLVPAVPGPAGAVEPEGRLVTEAPASTTPDVLPAAGADAARVVSVVRAGDSIVLGGTFGAAVDPGGDPSDPRLVSNLLAFDAASGAVRDAWAGEDGPLVDGPVNVVLPDASGESVWVGGRFRTVGGVERRNLARVSLADGSVLPWKAPSINGPVEDLRLVGKRLWVAGGFTYVGTRRQPGLATLKAGSGRFDAFMRKPVTGLQRPGRGTTDVRKIDVTPDGTRLVGVGNFREVGGQTRRQLVVLGIGGRKASVAPWRSSFFAEQCQRRYDSYVKDVDLSPDGSWFAVATTGANGGQGSACDSVTRFETRSRAKDVAPTWVANTGGDTTWAVEAAAGVLYTGGHFQWQNNPYGTNKDTPGEGAVVRTGIAALDPRNGLPLDWNPTRTRGVGVFDFLRTPDGLYVASDTAEIGGQARARIALLPAGGAVVPAQSRVRTPADLLLLGGSGDLDGRTTARRLVGQGRVSGGQEDLGAADWSGVRAAFLVGDRLYAARDDETFTVQDLAGGTPGPTTAVDTADQVRPMTAWHREVARSTGMVFDEGRLYYTVQGSTKLYARGFSPSSGVVGAVREVASSKVKGFNPKKVRGLTLVADRLYLVTPGGALRSVRWSSSAADGSPVPRTGRAVPGAKGRDWSAAALVARAS